MRYPLSLLFAAVVLTVIGSVSCLVNTQCRKQYSETRCAEIFQP